MGRMIQILRRIGKCVDWIAVISSVVAGCIYLNTLKAGFVYDDSRAILTNKDVLQQETPWQDIWKDDFWGTPLSRSGSHKSYRPLTVLSFRANRYFSGFNPWAYHLTNVILHSFTTWLFVAVGRIVLNLSNHVFHVQDQKRNVNLNSALLVSSLLFATHPVHTEAVAGVVGRADIMATFFALASFLAYHYHVKTRNNNNNNATTRNNNKGSGEVQECQCDQQKAKSNIIISSSSDSKRNPYYFNFPSALYFLLSVLLAAASMLCKEHGIMVIFVSAIYDFIVSLIRLKLGVLKSDGKSPSKKGLWTTLECRRSLILLGLCFVALFNIRLGVMGGLSPPQFAKADNPTAHNPSVLVRTLTFLFLPVMNLSLLLYPLPLSYDWSMEAVKQVESLRDPRNILTFLFYSLLLRRVYLSVLKLFHEGGDFTPNNLNFPQHQRSGVSPGRTSSCRICRFSMTPTSNSPQPQNHTQNKCSNNNNSILLCSSNNGEESSSVSSEDNHCPTPRPPSVPRNPTNSTFSSSPQRYHCHYCHSKDSSSTLKYRRRYLSLLEHGSLLVNLAFMVFPFIPASNLFLYVGFVIAERILYFPSIGFCLLVGHGCAQLLHKSSKRRGGSGSTVSPTLKKALLASLVITSLVMLSLRTIRRNEDWKDEGQLYMSGIAVNPPKSWGNLGNVLNSQGRLAEAEKAYREALLYRPNMAEVHYNLGLVLERRGKLEEALSSYRTAIHFRQQLAAAYVNAGQLLTRLGRIHQAMDMYKKCFNLNDDGVKDLRTHVEAKVSALLRFGRLLIEKEDAPKAAVKVYRQAMRIMPNDYEQKQSVYNAIGEALFRIGEINEAESWFLEALKTKPDHVPAHLTYGKMLARNKTRLLEAERWFRRAKKIAPQDASVYHHYGQFLAVQGRHAEAATAYVTAASLSPNDYDIVVGAANALRQSGNNKEAEIYYEKAVALRSQEARAHMNLGAILHVNGKYHEAEQSYLMALRLKPSDDITLLNLKKLRQLQARRNQFSMNCKNNKSNQQNQQVQSPSSNSNHHEHHKSLPHPKIMTRTTTTNTNTNSS